MGQIDTYKTYETDLYFIAQYVFREMVRLSFRLRVSVPIRSTS